MAGIKEKLASKIPQLREEIRSLVKEHGSKVISQVTVEQAYGGMRGVKSLVCDTSLVEPDTGLVIRNYPVKKLVDKLPEEVLWLLLTGELPNGEELKSLQQDLKKRQRVPDYVWKVLNAMPLNSHPMAMFNTLILVLERESQFRKNYTRGLRKEQYWESTLEDSLSIIAKLPALAAAVYRRRYKKGPRIKPNPKLDWAGNYAYMLGIKDPTGEFANLMRLYMVLHSDHESGNVSAFTTHTVNSALSDIYYALSAGLNGLAGPLHGLANQECLAWILESLKKFGGKVPSADDLRKFAWDTLNSGKVIPGYGHAVLRITDPRFEAFIDFGRRVCPDDPVFQMVALVFEVVPGVLKEQGKAKDPWPNVDAASGSLLYHFGLKEFEYYTVLFGVSRALGVCSQAVISRALGLPIVRPKSVTTEWIKKFVTN